MAPFHDETPLDVAEVANRYCPVGRDVFQRRVIRVFVPRNRAMEEGRALHHVLATAIIAAKRAMRVDGKLCLPALERRRALPGPWLEETRLDGPERQDVQGKARLLLEHQSRRIVHHVQDAASRQPQAGADALAAQALPVAVERDFHIIDDELRQAFLNERDEKARLVEEADDPGLPSTCYQWCPYLPVCLPGSRGEEQRGFRAGRSANVADRRAG